MQSNNNDPGWLYQLVMTGILSLLVALAIGGAVTGLDNFQHGLFVGGITFILAWALFMFVARTSVSRSRSLQ